MMEQNEPTVDRRCAIVTGASRGIGRAIALQLACDGFDVVVNHSGASSADAARDVVAEIEGATSARAIAFEADVSDDAAVLALAAAATDAFGRIDVLVNNAGIVRDDLVARCKDEDLDRMIEVNLKGAIRCIRAVSRTMVRQRYGRIVNMTSAVGVCGNAGQAGYAATKAGIIGMGKSVAKELASRGITVNMVAPGFIETDMTSDLPARARDAALERISMGRFGDPSDVAALVSFLASERAGYITGQVIRVDGGIAL